MSTTAKITWVDGALLVAEGGSGHVHVPYRSSKLTRLLRPALDGNSQFLLLCTISPLGGFHLEQTRSTLQFGQRALSIKVQPVVNISKPPVKLLQEEVLKLQTTHQEDAGGAREPEDPEDGEEEAPRPDVRVRLRSRRREQRANVGLELSREIAAESATDV